MQRVTRQHQPAAVELRHSRKERLDGVAHLGGTEVCGTEFCERHVAQLKGQVAAPVLSLGRPHRAIVRVAE